MDGKILLLSFAFVGYATALFYHERTEVPATGETSPQCFAHGGAGRCEFYSCFEDRLPCGSRGYMAAYGEFYCQRFADRYSAFTVEGQAWINSTSKCMTERLLRKYNQESVECHELAHFAWDTWSSCYMENGFCGVFQENRGAFYDVYQFRDLFRAGASKIWREMFTISTACITQRGTQEFNDQGGFSGLWSRISNLGNRIRDAVTKK